MSEVNDAVQKDDVCTPKCTSSLPETETIFGI